MSRTVLNGLLLLVVIGLAAAVWLSPSTRHPAPPALLPGLAPDGITRVDIQRRGEPDIVLEKDAHGWELTAPFRVPANDVRVAAVTALAGAESRGGFSAAGRDLKPFGLDPPAARVALNDTTVALGGVEPISARRYVKVGNTIRLVPDYYTNGITAPAADFVSLALLPEGHRPVAIAAPGITLRRGKDGHWVDVGAAGAPGSALDAFADRWHRARALDVEPAPAGAASSGTVTVETAAGPPLVFDIAQRSPELILARRDLGVAYHFPASETVKLLQLAPPAAAHDAGGSG